jgi:uncharacterized membrane protein
MLNSEDIESTLTTRFVVLVIRFLIGILAYPKPIAFMYVALISSVNLVFTGCIVLSVIVIVVAIRWIRDINKMKKDDH